MKILVLNGSPKAEKSDVMHITRAFLSGITDTVEAEIETVHAIEQDIRYCRGCFTCMQNGGTCVQQDDMADLLEKMLAADVLLFSFPLYNYGMPAPLKAILERTMPVSTLAMKKEGERYVHVNQREFTPSKYVMICGCGFPNVKHNFEGMIKQFELLSHGESTILTIPESPMFNSPAAEPATKPFLETVRRAGREYASGGITKETMERLSIPMIPEDVYAKICSGEIVP